MHPILLFLAFITAFSQTPEDSLTTAINALVKEQQLMGLQLQITKNSKIAYNSNFGFKDGKLSIQSSTLFRMASLSKSLSAVGVLRLVEKGKFALSDSLSDLLGFPVINPNFPNKTITLEMALSHRSSIIECDPYYSNFLDATYNAADGTKVPRLSDILQAGGKFYNTCLFDKNAEPGSYFRYVNINFGLAGAVIERYSGTIGFSQD